MKSTELDIKHYVERIKLHELLRVSTNDRNNYWKNYFKNKN